jgi:predicted Abi (CAAX) family protease
LILGRLGDGLFPLWNPTGQLAGLGIALAYSGVEVVLSLRSGLMHRQKRWPSPWRLLPRAGRWLLPAFGEELVFRGLLLPSALDGVQPLALLPWMALSFGLFVAWHHPAGWLGLRSTRRSDLDDPRVLVQTALLGFACSLAYGVSGSLWWAVLLHWLSVVAWREGLAMNTLQHKLSFSITQSDPPIKKEA